MDERRAFEDSLWECHPALWSFARRLAKADAEDLIQDTYVKALKSWRQFKTGTNIKAWMCTIMVSVWRDTLDRRQTNKAKLMVGFYEHSYVAPNKSDTYMSESEFLERIDVLVDDQMKNALLALSPEYKEALLLTVFSEETAKAAGDRLGISGNALKLRSHKACKKVRDTWKPRLSCSLSPL